jgi:hypothetical protein
LNLADADFGCTNVLESSFCCESHLLLGEDVSSHGVKVEMGFRVGLVLLGMNAYINMSGFLCCGGSTLALRFFACEDVTQHPSAPPVRNALLNWPDSLFAFHAPLSAFNLCPNSILLPQCENSAKNE